MSPPHAWLADPDLGFAGIDPRGVDDRPSIMWTTPHPHAGQNRSAVSLIEAILVIVLISASAAVGLTQFRQRPLSNREAHQLTDAVAAQIRAARIAAIREASPSVSPAGDFAAMVVAVRRDANDPSQLSVVTERWATNGNIEIKQLIDVPAEITLQRTPATVRFGPHGTMVRPDGFPAGAATWFVTHRDSNTSPHRIDVQPATSVVLVSHPAPR